MLSAAAQVDYLEHRAWLQVNLMHGTWRSLVMRKLLRPHRYGWQATERGRMVIRSNSFVITAKHQQKERRLMNGGKLPRYRVTRTTNGWVVVDRNLAKTKPNNDVVERHATRTAARTRTQQLNLQDLQEKNATGDAA